jgi:hypothetical protein
LEDVHWRRVPLAISDEMIGKITMMWKPNIEEVLKKTCRVKKANEKFSQ